MKPVTLQLKDDTYEKIKRRADENGIGPSKVVNNLVHKGLAYENLEDDVEEIIQRQKRRSEVSEKLREEINADLPTKIRWALLGKNE